MKKVPIEIEKQFLIPYLKKTPLTAEKFILINLQTLIRGLEVAQILAFK